MIALLALVVVAGAVPAAPVPAGKDSAEVKKLLQMRRKVLDELVRARQMEFAAGRIQFDSLLDALRKQLQLELELATKAEERIAALTKLLRVAAKAEVTTRERYKAGAASMSEFCNSRDFRLQCEIGLLRAGGTRPKDIPGPDEDEPKPRRGDKDKDKRKD
jgi:hypothetical protein